LHPCYGDHCVNLMRFDGTGPYMQLHTGP
jgi:hypothetical protein